jgi:phage-related tail fiber protein
MKIKIDLGKKGLIAIALLSATIAFASEFVTIVNGDYSSVDGIPQPDINHAKTGTIMMWATNTPPTGWLELNGQSTASYPDLAAIVGANVPDFRGEHIRGWDNGKGIDTGRSLLSKQNDAVKSHHHDLGRLNASSSVTRAKQVVNASGNNAVYSYYRYGTGNTYSYPHESNTVKAIGQYLGATMQTENRIKNKSVMFIIKAI